MLDRKQAKPVWNSDLQLRSEGQQAGNLQCNTRRKMPTWRSRTASLAGVSKAWQHLTAFWCELAAMPQDLSHPPIHTHWYTLRLPAVQGF